MLPWALFLPGAPAFLADGRGLPRRARALSIADGAMVEVDPVAGVVRALD